jgi:hypothetical protein
MNHSSVLAFQNPTGDLYSTTSKKVRGWKSSSNGAMTMRGIVKKRKTADVKTNSALYEARPDRDGWILEEKNLCESEEPIKDMSANGIS